VRISKRLPQRGSNGLDPPALDIAQELQCEVDLVRAPPTHAATRCRTREQLRPALQLGGHGGRQIDRDESPQQLVHNAKGDTPIRLAMALCRWQKALYEMDGEAAILERYSADDALDGGQQDLPTLTSNNVDIIGAGLEDLGHAAQRPAVVGHHLQAEDLIVVVHAGGQRRKKIGAQPQDLAAHLLGLLTRVTARKLSDRVLSMTSEAFDHQRPSVLAQRDSPFGQEKVRVLGEQVQQHRAVDAKRSADASHRTSSSGGRRCGR
jgi:hypothetical protein